MNDQLRLTPYFSVPVSPWKFGTKKNPELVARGREASFLKGSKAR
jgi:hypothetical protein